MIKDKKKDFHFKARKKLKINKKINLNINKQITNLNNRKKT